MRSAFTGPTGVGKTETAHAVARAVLERTELVGEYYYLAITTDGQPYHHHIIILIQLCLCNQVLARDPGAY